MNSEVLDRVRRIAADTFDVDYTSVTVESSPSTIEAWDSLTHLNFVMALEESFSCEIDPVEMEAAARGLGEVVKLLEAKVARSL